MLHCCLPTVYSIAIGESSVAVAYAAAILPSCRFLLALQDVVPYSRRNYKKLKNSFVIRATSVRNTITTDNTRDTDCAS